MPQKQRVYCSLNKTYGSAFTPTFPPHTLCLWQYASLSWITIINPFPRTLLPLLQHWLPLGTLNFPQTRTHSKHNLSKYVFTAVVPLNSSEMQPGSVVFRVSSAVRARSSYFRRRPRCSGISPLPPADIICFTVTTQQHESEVDTLISCTHGCLAEPAFNAAAPAFPCLSLQLPTIPDLCPRTQSCNDFSPPRPHYERWFQNFIS